ncbi:MAG TPA: hypothetical protein DGT21_25125 [Armatimonadetes bacterium]|jgi:cell division septation protein DedD|nr:hypothetical protein [Armatimonadota bacterium]
MARPEKRITWKTLFVFWVKVLVLCAVLGAGSFYIGRNYLGSMLSETDIREGAPRLNAQAPGTEQSTGSSETTGPAKAEVRIEERQPSDLEAQRARDTVGGRGDADSPGLSDGRASDGGSDGSDATGAEAGASATESGRDSATTSAADSASTGRAASGDQAASREPTETSDDGQYVVTAGSFVSAENSQKLLEELEAKGYQPYISKTTIGDKTYRRVNIGAFSSQRDAGKLADELRNSGYEASVRKK